MTNIKLMSEICKSGLKWWLETQQTFYFQKAKAVKFVVDGAKLAMWNRDMKYEVEPGVFEIMVGRSSTDVQKMDLTVN